MLGELEHREAKQEFDIFAKSVDRMSNSFAGDEALEVLEKLQTAHRTSSHPFISNPVYNAFRYLPTHFIVSVSHYFSFFHSFTCVADPLSSIYSPPGPHSQQKPHTIFHSERSFFLSTAAFFPTIFLAAALCTERNRKCVHDAHVCAIERAGMWFRAAGPKLFFLFFFRVNLQRKKNTLLSIIEITKEKHRRSGARVKVGQQH
jgi:hypothetical protein